MPGVKETTEVYEIRVREHLDNGWANRFDGFLIAHEADGSTVVTGPIADQAALHGLLIKVRDRGLTLLSVNRVGVSRPGSTRRKDGMDGKLGSHYRDFVSVAAKMAVIYLYEARFDDALELLNDGVLALLKKDAEAVDWARLQIQRAGIVRYKGYCYHAPELYDQALDILSGAMSAIETSGDMALLADALDLRGLALHSKEPHLDSSQAERLRCFEQALEIRQAIHDTRGVAESHFHIGLVYQQRRQASEDDKQKALEHFQNAYQIASKGGFRFEQAHAARHLAYLYDELGEPGRAYECHKEFLETNETFGFKPYLSPANVMVGLAHFKRGELGEAARYFQTAHELASELDSKPFLADACLMLGVTAAARGEREEARARLEEALSWARPIEHRRVINLTTREIEKLEQES